MLSDFMLKDLQNILQQLELSLHITLPRHVRKMRNFFSKYADHVIAKYAAKLCGNRPQLHIRINLTRYIFGGWDSTVVI